MSSRFMMIYIVFSYLDFEYEKLIAIQFHKIIKYFNMIKLKSNSLFFNKYIYECQIHFLIVTNNFSIY